MLPLRASLTFALKPHTQTESQSTFRDILLRRAGETCCLAQFACPRDFDIGSELARDFIAQLE